MVQAEESMVQVDGASRKVLKAILTWKMEDIILEIFVEMCQLKPVTEIVVNSHVFTGIPTKIFFP